MENIHTDVRVQSVESNPELPWLRYTLLRDLSDLICYFLHQSYSKLKPIANCSLAFSRALTSLPIFTSSSLWLLVIISLLWLAIVIALALVLRKLLYLSISRTRCVIPINYAFFSFFHRNKWTPLPRELRTWWCGGRPIDLESRSTVPARYTWKQERIC